MDWKIAYAHACDCENQTLCTISNIERAGLEIIPASVPGNLELDLMRAGKLPDLYFSTNVEMAHKLEDIHVWYFTTVCIKDKEQFLRFEGIDTYANIYVNGKLVRSTDNMFLPYDIQTDWVVGDNEVVVHIKPTMHELRQFTPPVACNALKYSYPTLYVRKAAHMFGWDIMPRIVSCGIWKDVIVRKNQKDKIKEVYFAVNKVDLEKETADIRFCVNTDISGALASDYTVKVEGVCEDSRFEKEEKLWHNTHAFHIYPQNCKFWWPKNAGNPNLYDITVTLYKKEVICDTYKFRAGIRTVELRNTDITDGQGEGEFCFYVNGKRIFILGMNWVPLDAFHSRDGERLPRAVELLNDLGCNMVRCWGGNVYESDAFYNYCDVHGIMVWQDFGMACATYPREEQFVKRLEEEAIYQVKRLRNHASLALWTGDNECDWSYQDWSGFRRNPSELWLTREVLKHVVEMHDYTRTYLPSSPYVSEKAFYGEGLIPENHLWGERDYFKSSFYKDTFCHFVSETGYPGINSPKSLEKFLASPEEMWKEDGSPTDEYVLHSTSMECGAGAPYTYRMRKVHEQVRTLFGKPEKKLEDYVKQSQISQAEAVKYFVEKFRIAKWKRTGILLWNLLDGWPQISEALVDYYFDKKLAYFYIKRCYQPVCLMFDEPEQGKISLIAVNDLADPKELMYTVKRISEEGEDEIVLCGQCLVSSDSAEILDKLELKENEKEFYLIEWQMEGKTHRNHYFTNVIKIEYRKYINALKKCELDDFSK